MIKQAASTTEHPQPRGGKKKLFGRWALIFLATTLLSGVVCYLLIAEDSIDVRQTKELLQLQTVSVTRLRVAAETAEVTGYAEVRPRWSTELRAAVSGRVTEVRDNAMAGERAKRGATLITIDDSRYQADLAAAEHELKQAELLLRKAKVNTAVARQEYRHTGTEPLNDLALHLPELEIAAQAVRAAQANVVVARRQLADTVISAPFSGFVVERFVSPGQSVNDGDPLLKLVDDSAFELTVPLDRKDWGLLRQPISGLQARLFDLEGKPLGGARIRRGGDFLDEETRQYRLFMDISAAAPNNILSGDFVQVVLPGREIPAALCIPASALTQEGYLWYLDDESSLQRLTAKVLFRRQDQIVIEAPQGTEQWRIATTPLLSFLPGQRVRAQEVER